MKSGLNLLVNFKYHLTRRRDANWKCQTGQMEIRSYLTSLIENIQA